MGLFSAIKLLVQAISMSKEEKRCHSVTLAQAREMDNDELASCVMMRLNADSEEELNTFSQPVRLAYTVIWYQAEVNNGGLCQYFVNSSSMTAPYLEQALCEMGANRHLSLFHNFVTKHGIDVTDLSSFKIDEVEEFEEQEERYPFDDFDEAFYELEGDENSLTETLTHCLGVYIRQHITNFFN